MTSSPPRVESRPVPVAITLGRAGGLPFLTLRAPPGRPRLGCGDSVGTVVRGADRPAAPRRSWGESVGIFARLSAAIVIRDTLFLPYTQVRELTGRKREVVRDRIELSTFRFSGMRITAGEGTRRVPACHLRDTSVLNHDGLGET